MKGNENPIIRISCFIDENLFKIRAVLNTAMAIGTFLLIRHSKHGHRIKEPSNSKLYGRFIVDGDIRFYHEPFFVRLFMGRKRIEGISKNDCILLQKKVNENIHGKFGYLKNDSVYIRLKWFHLTRTKL
jgi:hypothetical protein